MDNFRFLNSLVFTRSHCIPVFRDKHIRDADWYFFEDRYNIYSLRLICNGTRV